MDLITIIASVIEAKNLISPKKTFGKLLWIRGVYEKAFDYNKNLFLLKNFRTCFHLDQGIHMLDLILFFTKSKIQKIHSLLTTSFWKIVPEDNAFVF